MAFPTKLQTPVASHERSQHDLSAPHVTTGSFMKFYVSKAMELVPGQSLQVQHDCFSRLEPLPVPTFGLADIRHRAFWVPFRTVFSEWNDFINDTPHLYDDGTSAIPTFVPSIRNNVFLEFLSSDSCAVMVSLDEEKPSFSVSGGDGDTFFYTFTPYGRYVYSFLRSLGYAPQMYRDCENIYSAMPLLCSMKIYLDWYFPAQYAQSDRFNALAKYFIRNNPIDPGEDFFTAQDLDDIFRTLFDIAYEPDYFTSAWDNPVAPNSNLYSSDTMVDVTTSQSASTLITNEIIDEGTPIINSSADGFISQYSLDALRSLTDYMKRNQLVGSRAMDRYLARFGVKLSSEKLNRSVFIQEFRQQIQFGDVTSTANTEGASLGDYAGKGISYGENSYQVDSEGEYGFFMVITTIMPKVHYYQGLDRHCLHISKTDFWTPEYDGLGVQAISQAEYFSPLSSVQDKSSTFNGPVDTDNVFGFTGRYAEYKVPHALISGDFIDDSINVGKDSWTLFRDVSKNNIYHDINTILSNDSEQYDRIFQNLDSGVEKFNIIHNFNIQSSFPGRSIFDTYEFKDEDESQKVSMDVGGTTVS